MSESTTDLGSRRGLPRAETRCPACGQPLARLVRGRCPLCDYPVEDEPVTGQDRTPYAQSGHYGRRAWWAMCKWIWGAGAGRLAHLALMQSSPASRRFGRVNAALVVLTVAGCWLWLSGWHAVRVLPGTVDGEALTPSGKGWLLLALASGEAPARVGPPRAGHTVSWWWNPPRALLGSVLAFVGGLVLAWLLLAILRTGVERSLRRRYRGQERLAAAVRYSTAWALPLIPAGLILLPLPICRLAAVAGWPVQPPETFLYVPAAVVAAFGLLMWWFGLIRTASTVPVRTRGRVVLFCGLSMPLIAAALAAGSFVALLRLQDLLARMLQLQW